MVSFGYVLDYQIFSEVALKLNITACPDITKETQNLFGWPLIKVRETSLGLEAVS